MPFAQIVSGQTGRIECDSGLFGKGERECKLNRLEDLVSGEVHE